MTYEKDIPDFALMPARQPEERVLIPVTQGAVYSPVQVTNIIEKPKTVIVLEEDILVPDTRPDLKEILDISGKVRFSSREMEAVSKTAEPVTLAGEIELQTLYIPEKSGPCGPVIATSSRIVFREPWHTSVAPGAVLTMDAAIDNISCMVINERKYRVKVTVSVSARECQDQRLEIFEGISGEDIQTLRETVEITNIALRKKDIITIKETLEERDGLLPAETVLRQDIHVVENYRQAAAEKVIINGFICVSLLCLSPVKSADAESGEADGTGCSTLYQRQDRVEFTQFIPLNQSGQWSGCSAVFDSSDLRVKMVQNEEGRTVLQLEGDILTWIEVYRNSEKEFIADGYHRQKDFVCDFEEAACRTLAASACGETAVREVFSLESPKGEAEEILYAAAEIAGAESSVEPGRVVTEGTLQGKMLCRGTEPEGGSVVFMVQQEIPFRCVTVLPQLSGGEIASHRIYLKDLWAEKSGSRQAELNASLLVCTEVMQQTPLKVLKNPAFEEVQGVRPQPKQMAVYITREGDSLWSVAKQFKTTADSISRVNQLESSTLAGGQKLLILR